jgi:2-polyprenyl-3-methyl-5-hydroxy-6-metoxy-1,4-benzoquinol methylase
MKLQYGPDKKQYELYQGADYQSFWEGIARQKLDELEQVIIRDLLSLPARRLIDVGCGFGRLAHNYLDQAQEVVMLDSSVTLLQQARERTGGRALYIACDMHQIPFCPGSFDRVMMVRVLHHLPDGKAALSVLSRLLAGQGRLIFSYCNKTNLEQVARWAIGRNKFNPFSHEPVFTWGAFVMHHPQYIDQVLLENGLVKTKARGAGVVDKIAGRLNHYGKHFPSGVHLSPLFGDLGLAPWVFLQAEKPTGQPLEADLPAEKLLRCLKCGGELSRSEEEFRCVGCGDSYPIHDGIIDFLPKNEV